jgi:hypothetical protein
VGLRVALLAVIALFAPVAWAGPTVRVVAEEEVYSFDPPDNGSGPMWNRGCTTILRLKDGVVVAQYDVDLNVPLLCRARWRLLKREPEGWKPLAEAEGFRQREPAVLGTTDGATWLLNVNDSVMPPGTQYGKCEPHLLKFSFEEPGSPTPIRPVWKGETNFTDHSYRGFATDAGRGEILMLNINAETSAEHWCYMDGSGATLASGEIHFPIRACYPQVALRDGAGYVLAIGDIKEPVKDWAEYKLAQTGRAWDYVFRILYFTQAPDLKNGGFSAPIEIANVDATAGYIANQDLWIAPDGSAYLLYTEQAVQSALMRDKFFPDLSVAATLHLAVVKDGRVVERRVFHEGKDEDQVSWARFHETPDGKLYALVAFSGSRPRNALVQVYPKTEPLEFVPVPFQTPFGSFLLATVRAGCAPSNTIDLIGHQRSGTTLSYGQLEVGEEG